MESKIKGYSYQRWLDGSWRITDPNGKVTFISTDYHPSIETAIEYVRTGILVLPEETTDG
jgi:hypothetical protein